MTCPGKGGTAILAVSDAPRDGKLSREARAACASAALIAVKGAIEMLEIAERMTHNCEFGDHIDRITRDCLHEVQHLCDRIGRTVID